MGYVRGFDSDVVSWFVDVDGAIVSGTGGGAVQTTLRKAASGN